MGDFSTLAARLRKTSTIKATTTLDKSTIFNDVTIVTTPVPIVNVALTGSVDGGLPSGITVIAGPSRHFKSTLCLLCVASYLRQFEDAVCLFYDSEFGAKEAYFNSMGIDPARVVHTPVTNIEELKMDMIQQIDTIEKGDRIIIFVDSVGNIASKKEVEDALNSKSVADMSRAKAMKSLFRIITPHFTLKDIPGLFVAHTYECVTKDTNIIMADGAIKNITDVALGDLVKTPSGSQRVSYVVRHDPPPILFEVEMEDGTIIRCTPGHRFMTENRGWVTADDLTPDDILTVL